MSIKVVFSASYKVFFDASSKKDAENYFKPIFKKASDFAEIFGLEYSTKDFGYRPASNGLPFLKEYSATVVISVTNSNTGNILDLARTIKLFADINGLSYLDERFDFYENED